ncbi:hypothetical protein G9A89_002480 [Geosiphon pyriformis]|nr:hypothetical protein G9A89_002480 [Geosiphon pyriformis]
MHTATMVTHSPTTPTLKLGFFDTLSDFKQRIRPRLHMRDNSLASDTSVFTNESGQSEVSTSTDSSLSTEYQPIHELSPLPEYPEELPFDSETVTTSSSFITSTESGGKPSSQPSSTAPSIISSPSTKRSTFSAIKGALNSRPRGTRHVERMFTELNLPIPSGQETILFGGYVAKWTSKLFKKNSKDFLVLTQKCLCRFKSSERVIKTFDSVSSLSICMTPCIDESFLSRQTTKMSRNSPNASSLEFFNKKVVTADNILLSLSTVYSVSQQISPELMIRINYITSPKKHAYLSIYSETLEEHEQWLNALRPAIRQAESIGPYLTETQRRWVTERLQSVDDFGDDDIVENNLIAFRVSLNTLSDKGPTSESGKELHIPVMFVMGRNNIYLLPTNMNHDGTPNDNRRSSKTYRFDNTLNSNTNNMSPQFQYPLLVEETRPKDIDIHKYQYPLLCLTGIHAEGKDDTFKLSFKNHSNGSMIRTMLLSSALSENIVTSIRTAIDAITIWWPEPSYRLCVPNMMQATMVPEEAGKKATKGSGFERMIEAQCYAFRVDRERIAYSIEYVMSQKRGTLSLDIEHLPFRFVLLTPNDESPEGSTYTNAELLAILNALRYNPLLHEVVFDNISLFDLQIQPGPEGHKGENMLAAELYDLLLSNPKLRKLDLTGCGTTGDTISAIGYALMTGQSSLERLVLANNSLTRDGAHALAGGIASHGTPIRELDVSNGNLEQKSLETILDALNNNFPEQLEALNLSKNSCDIDPDILVEYLAKTVALKNLNLRNCSRFFKKSTPIISIYTLGETNLTTLDLGGVPLNKPKHTNALFEYIESRAFSSLRFFSIDHCGLDGDVLSVILSLISKVPNRNKLRVWAGGNNLTETDLGHKKLCQTIRENLTPHWLSMTDCVLGLNTNQVVEIISAFAQNTVIEILDLSFPHLGALSIDNRPNPMVPVIAKRACEQIGKLIGENKALKELTLRGDGNKRWGPTLGVALKKLEGNSTLDKLIIRGNAIGDEGARHLSHALMSNTSLRVLNIDENEIGLDGYLMLHSVLTSHLNTTLHEFSHPNIDLLTHQRNLDTKVSIVYRESAFFSLPTSRISARMASERQKFSFHEIIEEILAVVQMHQLQRTAYYNKF